MANKLNSAIVTALPKINSFVWSTLLILVFIRPFLSEQVFLGVGFWYVLFFILTGSYFVFVSKINLLSSPLNLAVFIFMGLIVFSSLSSRVYKTGLFMNLFELCIFLPNILIFYIAGKINQKQQNQLILAIFLAAGIIGVYAIYQYFFGFRHVLDYVRKHGINAGIDVETILSRRRIYATFITANIFASYVIMILCSKAGFLISYFSLTRKNIYLMSSICILMISLVFTKSFGAILVVVSVFLLFIFYLLRGFKGEKTILRRFFLCAVIVLFILVIFFFIFNWQRLIAMFNLNDPDNSIVQRFNYWITSLKIIKDFPLIGIGWKKFGFAYEFYRLPSAKGSDYSHNVFLQIMVEMGLLGLISFLFIVVIFLRSGYKILKSGGSRQAFKLGLFCAGCSFLIYNLIDISFYFSQVAFFWWIILGLFVNFSAEEKAG